MAVTIQGRRLPYSLQIFMGCFGWQRYISPHHYAALHNTKMPHLSLHHAITRQVKFCAELRPPMSVKRNARQYDTTALQHRPGPRHSEVAEFSCE